MITWALDPNALPVPEKTQKILYAVPNVGKRKRKRTRDACSAEGRITDAEGIYVSEGHLQ